MEFTLQNTDELQLDRKQPETAPVRSKVVGVKPSAGHSELSGWRKELDQYYELMQTFQEHDIDEILRTLSSMTSRVSHIRSRIVRAENRQTQTFRTREIDPFIEECDRQFKIWSRVLSIHSMDWELSKRDGM